MYLWSCIARTEDHPEARRWCVKVGLFPPTMLTTDELMAQEIELNDNRGYSARRELIRRFCRD
jgi:hypothetical protein